MWFSSNVRDDLSANDQVVERLIYDEVVVYVVVARWDGWGAYKPPKLPDPASIYQSPPMIQGPLRLLTTVTSVFSSRTLLSERPSVVQG